MLVDGKLLDRTVTSGLAEREQFIDRTLLRELFEQFLDRTS